MTAENDQRVNLFSYGTLQTQTVQLSIFGRTIQTTADALVGYQLSEIQVEEPKFLAHSPAVQRNVQYTGNTSHIVEGPVLALTKKELEQADAYEPAEYKRVSVQLRSGLNAWVYLNVPGSK